MAGSKHERWFAWGCEAWSRVHPPDRDTYVCPCCLRHFDADDLDNDRLSLEDVPPAKVGGRPLLLTCAERNNNAGTEFDVHAMEEEKVRRLTQLEPGVSTKSRIRFGSSSLNGTLKTGPDGLLFVPEPGVNKPGAIDDAVAELTEARRRGESPPFEVQLSRRSEAWRVEVSWIRAAYFACFALWGYRYAIQSALDPVRSQLASPDECVLPDAVVWPSWRKVLPLDDMTIPRIVTVEQPMELRAVVVCLPNNRVVTLPPANSQASFFEDFAATVNRLDGRQFMVAGNSHDWPKWPMHTMDS